MSTTRVYRVTKILETSYPYRVNKKVLRAVCAVLPTTRARYRPTQDRFIAAIVALPYRIGEKSK